jgi:hypothetical protein
MDRSIGAGSALGRICEHAHARTHMAQQQPPPNPTARTTTTPPRMPVSVLTCTIEELLTVLRGAMPGRKNPIEGLAARAAASRRTRLRIVVM